MGLLSNDVRRYQVIISAIFGILCIIIIALIWFFDLESEAVEYRFKDAEDVFNGRPITMEFPPLALVFVTIPRIFSATPFGYNVGYITMMAVFFVVGLLITCKIAERLGKDQKTFMLAYSVFTFALFTFVIDRHDIIPVVLTLAAIYCYITKRYTWAFAFLALGTMVKLYPAVLFLVFLIPLMMERRWNDALKGIGGFAVASLAILVPVLIVQPDMLFYFIDYHSDRPLQIESTAATIISLFSMAGLTETHRVFSYGSDNVIGPWPDAVAPWLTPLAIASVVIVAVVYLFMLKNIRGKGDANDRMYLFAGFTVLSVAVFILMGKVFSSQYIMWVIPPLLFMLMLSDDPAWKRTAFVLFLATIGMIILQFSYIVAYLGGGENINDLSFLMIFVKNVVMVAFTYHVVRSVYERYRSVERSPDQGPC